MRTSSNIVIPLLFLGALVILLLGNQYLPYLDQDEAAYVGIAKNYLESENWIKQHFYWSEIHRKTPWHTWTLAAMISTASDAPFWVRLPSVLAIWFSGLSVFLLGKKYFTPNVSLVAAFLFYSNWLVFMLCKVALTDAWLLLFETVAGLSLLLIFERYHIKWLLLFWGAISLGMLTKGPAILIFVGMMSLLLLLFHPSGSKIWRLRPWFGFPMALLPLLAWGYAYWQIDEGKTIKWLIDWYILKRAGGEAVISNQTGYPGYFLIVFGISFCMFLPFFIKAVGGTFQAFFHKKKRTAEGIFLASWIIGGWLLYELIPSKLPTYAQAAIPGFCLSMSLLFYQYSISKWLKYLHIGLLVTLGVGLGIVPTFVAEIDAKWLGFPLGIVLVGTVFLFYKIKNYRVLLVGSFVFYLTVNVLVLPQISILLDGNKRAALALAEMCPSGDVQIFLDNVKGMPPSLPLYIEQQCEIAPQLFMDRHPVVDSYHSPPWAAYLLSKKKYDTLAPDLYDVEPIILKANLFAPSSWDYYLFVNPSLKKHLKDGEEWRNDE